MKLSVFKAVGMTFAFVLQHWLDLLKIVWLPLVLVSVVSIFVTPGYMHAMSGVTTGSQPSPEEAVQMMSTVLPAAFGIMIAAVATYMIIFAGILKLVIRGDKPSLPFYLGFGSDEWRLLGTWLLCLLIFIGVEILAIIVGGLAGGLAAAAPGFGAIAALVVGVAVLVAVVWICLRLSLATPAAIGAQTIGIGPSWNVSKGNVWRLLGYWLIWIVMFLIVEGIVFSLLMPGYFQAIGSAISAGAGSPEDMQAAMSAMNEQMLAMYDMSSLGGIMRFVGGFVNGTIIVIFSVVAGGVAWRLMTDDRPEKQFE